MSKQAKNQTQERPPESQSTTSSTEQNELLQGLLGILAPLVQFHRAVEGASSNDLRLYWDVRLIQGEDTPFMETHGSTSLPSVLSGSAASTLPQLVYNEIEEKVARTLQGRLQDQISNAGLDALPVSPPQLTEGRGGKDDHEEENGPIIDVADKALEAAASMEQQ